MRGEPKLVYPECGPFYKATSDLWYPMVRIAAGLLFFIHGWLKLTGAGATGLATAYLAPKGIEPALPIAYLVIFIEVVGGICITLGLLTRPFAAAAAIELAVITFVYQWPNGLIVSAPRGGYEFSLLWGILMFAIALRGGGPYSVDRTIGKEI
jgi:putative oxidoreductase